ncbi:MAG: DNA primase [Patescibacteria group bacterium]
MNPSEEIKSRLDIVDIIREYIQLKSAGANFQALCPFHREKTPSFSVSPEKQIWHCFGCGKGGDVISFVMEMEGITFVEALRSLAPKAGVTLKKENSQMASQRNRLLDIMETAVNYYHRNLLESEEAKPAREYLYKRGLTDKTIGEWQLGYSPESWDDILNLLKEKGYSEREVFQAGLSIKKEGRESYYNRFRGRIMFPINEFNGNTVAFSARVRPDKEEQEKLGKYINSPQTMIYDKSRILFGLDKAKLSIRNAKFVVVVEGQMDVITAHQHGFKNVVASSGTALTEAQLQLLKRYSENIALAFDMDEAGKMAADRGIKEAMKQDVNIKIVTLPGGKDPDELIRNNPEEFKTALENSQYVIDYYFRILSEDLDLNSVKDKKEAVKRMLPVINKIENKIERDEWIRRLSEAVNIDERYLRESLPKRNNSGERGKKDNEYSEPVIFFRKSREEMLSEALLALVIKFPVFLEHVINRLEVGEIAGEDNKIFYKDLIIHYNDINSGSEKGGPDFNILKEKFGSTSAEQEQDLNRKMKVLDKLAVLGEKDFYNFDNDRAKKEILGIVKELKKIYISTRKKEIEQLISQAEKQGDHGQVESLMKELKTLSDEYSSEE